MDYSEMEEAARKGDVERYKALHKEMIDRIERTNPLLVELRHRREERDVNSCTTADLK